ncbi:hypothetical protein [Streptomyces sp. STR69]|uniref:hypothetical protein n=1 Tax=Streptomyces sp. STR69 TaxID=1796942 RepID=UPI0021C7FD0E|nr:hypothetical protein [Streptomyces sp. STR69]
MLRPQRPGRAAGPVLGSGAPAELGRADRPVVPVSAGAYASLLVVGRNTGSARSGRSSAR